VLGNCLDPGFSGGTQRFAQRGDLIGQAGLFHDRIRPEGIHQLGLSEHAALTPNQQEQKVKRFRRQSYALARTSQQPFGCIQPVRPEFE
jgi:hypothetical protein